MMNIVKGSCLLLAVGATIANAGPVLVERLSQTPPAWNEIRSPHPNHLIKLSIGLQIENNGVLERTLYEISDPKHKRYGKHLTRDAATALLQPRSESVDTVKRWLSDSGVSEVQIRHEGQFVHAHVPVEQAESLLATRFQVFARDEEEVIRTREYSVPEEIRRHIASIQPTTFFGGEKVKSRSVNTRAAGKANRNVALDSREPAPKHQHHDGVDLEACKSELTPACIRKIYRMGDTYGKPHPKSLFGVAGFAEQAAQYDQLESFLESYAPYAVGANFTVDVINGATNPQGEYPAGEANLDIQYAVAMAYDVPVRYYPTGGLEYTFNPDLDNPSPYGEPFLAFAQYFLDLDDSELPQVISISYGLNEQEVPEQYAKQVCSIFGQLGTRGVSIIAASGDTGPGFSCQSNDGTESTKFLPTFPAACPYVTSVGATESNSPEKALNVSSGGFSEYFPRPSWQDHVVGKYLNKHGDKWQGYYNQDGRGYPDVAALGTNYQIVSHGEVQDATGTSASAPVFAAMIAVINDQRFRRGKPSLGFLNPLIYSIGHLAFTDITQGKSEGCKGQSIAQLPAPYVPDASWDAVQGWDPVTGLGTPLFDRLSKFTCN